MLSVLFSTNTLLLGATQRRFSSEVFVWLGVIVLLGLFLGVFASWLRRRLSETDQAPPLGFTLKDLRQLHAMGQLSDEELQKAEEKSLAKSRSLYLGDEDEALADADPPLLSPPQAADEDPADSPPPEDETAPDDDGTENPPGLSDKNPKDRPET